MDVISITPFAWEKIHSKLDATNGKYNSVKIRITTKGCSGYSYVFDVVSDEPADDEVCIEDGQHKVIITKDVELFVMGATLDFVIKDKLSSGFDFINDLEKSRCGCGESFHI